MSFLLRLCLGLVFLAPSLAHAQFLETPLNGDKLSGIGVIRGWKCEATGDITVRFDGDEALTFTMVYGSERPDTKETSDGTPVCGDTDNGFLFLFNWAILGDGEHTAVAYDNGVEFARSTFSVATAGEEYLGDAPDTCVTVNDFPSTGETTYLEWNTSTQHFEMVESCGPTPSEPVDHGMCTVGLTVNPGEMCSGTLLIYNYTFTVNAEGEACIDGTGIGEVDRCHSLMLPGIVVRLGVDATRNDDGSWTINDLP